MLFPLLVPIAVAALPDITNLSAGQAHSCGLAEGVVWCWGGATFEEVKAGTWSSRRSPVAVELPGLAVGVSAGGKGQTCAVLADSSVFCWALKEVPQRVPGVKASDVAVGLGHACAVGSAGVSCWGGNGSGQLGTGDTAPRDGVVVVSGLAQAVAIDVGDAHSCARLASGQVRCWGSNAHGQLGSGNAGKKGVAPADVMWVQDAVQVATGSFHTCLVRTGGGVLCFGDNLDGQLGDGSRTASVTPVAPQGVVDVVQLDGGFGHTCAVRRDGALYCWGASESGQVGSGDGSDQLLPGFVRGVTDATEVSAGQSHTCVVRGGVAQCMGSNQASQLGDGSATGRSNLAPVGG